MIKSEYNEKYDGCLVDIVGDTVELTRELGAIFDSFAKKSDSKMILLSVIDTYLGKEIKGEFNHN